MADDLVKWLREMQMRLDTEPYPEGKNGHSAILCDAVGLCLDAADRIEALQRDLRNARETNKMLSQKHD